MSEDAVQQIKGALSISDIVGRYVALKKNGNRFKACCPFHHEKTPSFTVDNEKGFYYCFGCKAGGDHFKFIQAIENLSFVESLELLADIAGIDLPKRGRMGANRKVVELYRQIYEEACQFFVKRLESDKKVKDYLLDRGLSDSIIKLFRLGVAPDSWDGLFQFMQGRFPDEALAKCGLFKKGKTGRYYDIFRDMRVIFPIMDVHGHTVAFGARKIEGEGPKYINSPETPIYTKGKHVYNLNFARPYLKKSTDVIVVEGYMDVIQVYQAGFGAVVAPLGTAFTQDQARLVKRYAKNVLLSFDGDRAGFQAARKSIDVLLSCDLDPKIIKLPEGMDPDDFILKEGVESYRQKMETATDFFDFLFGMFYPKTSPPNPREASTLIQELLPTISKIADPVVKDAYLDQLAQRTGASMESINKLHSISEHASPPQAGHDPGRKEPISPDGEGFHGPIVRLSFVEEELIRMLLMVPGALDMLDSDDRALFLEALQNLFEDRPWILTFLSEGEEPHLESLQAMPDLHASQLKRILLEDDLHCEALENAKELMFSLFNDLIIIYLKKQSSRYSMIRKGLADSDFEKAAMLSRKKADIEKKIRQLTQQARDNKGLYHGG